MTFLYVLNSGLFDDDDDDVTTAKRKREEVEEEEQDVADQELAQD